MVVAGLGAGLGRRVSSQRRWPYAPSHSYMPACLPACLLLFLPLPLPLLLLLLLLLPLPLGARRASRHLQRDVHTWRRRDLRRARGRTGAWEWQAWVPPRLLVQDSSDREALV